MKTHYPQFTVRILVSALWCLFIAQGCSTYKSPAVPLDQFQAESPPRMTEFILGPGDKLDISVYNNDDLKTSAQIDLSGKFIFPLVGDVQAAGLSIFQLRDKIRDGLKKYIIDPQVTIGISTSQSQKVIVLGEVKSPGYFQADSGMTALEAVSRAGGISVDGKMESVLLIRGGLEKPQLTVLNLERTLKEADLSQNVSLQRGDILYVPRTFISDVDRFFGHVSTILTPFVQLETGIFLYKNLTQGKGTTAVAP
jgi:polysaccharide export outer membrane protein